MLVEKENTTGREGRGAPPSVSPASTEVTRDVTWDVTWASRLSRTLGKQKRLLVSTKADTQAPAPDSTVAHCRRGSLGSAA